MSAVKTVSLYSLHTSHIMQEKVIANLKKKTDRTLKQWTELAQKSRLTSKKEIADWIKENYELGGTTASIIAAYAVGEDPLNDYDPEALVTAQYQKDKMALYPIYDKLLKLGLSLGDDVSASPCKTFVPLSRRYVFAQLKPTTKTRIDLGLALGRIDTVQRLILTGGLEKKDRITHRIAVTKVEEIDAELIRWFKKAYDLSG